MKIHYDILSWLATQLTFSFAVAPFVLLGVLLLGSAAIAVRPLRRAADTAVPPAVPDARKPPPAPEGERSAVSGRCGPGEETPARTDPEEPTP